MKQFRTRLGAVALALLVVIATFGFALPAAAQDSTVTEIDSCIVITEPGTYVLTDDIENSEEDACIRIEDGLDGVTIDGDGHTIDGVDGNGAYGIYAGLGDLSDGDETTDVTVENVVLTDWASGVTFENVESSTIRDSTMESNERGVLLFDGATDVEVADNVLTGNDIGILALGGRVTIVDNAASNEIDYSGVASEDDGNPDHTVENLTLDTATVSLENDIEQIDFFGGGASLDVSAAESLPDDPEGLTNVGGYVEADTDSNTNDSFVLSVHYDDEALDGVDEDSLALYQFVDGEWTEVPGSSVDTDGNAVSAEFDDPAEFADGAVLAPFGNSDGDGSDDNGADDGDDSDAGDDDAGDSDDDATGGDKSDDKNTGDSDADGDDAADDGDTDGGDVSDVGSADGDESDDDGDVVDVGRNDIVIDLGDVTIAGLDLDGPGLSDEHVDERTYLVGDFEIEFAGLSLTIGDTEYRFCKVSITVEPFDVILEDVTLGDGE